MKAKLLVAIMSITILCSCSKSYTCTCTSVQPDGTITNEQQTTIKGTKNSAEKNCQVLNNVNGQTTTTCVLTN